MESVQNWEKHVVLGVPHESEVANWEVPGTSFSNQLPDKPNSKETFQIIGSWIGTHTKEQEIGESLELNEPSCQFSGMANSKAERSTSIFKRVNFKIVFYSLIFLHINASLF